MYPDLAQDETFGPDRIRLWLCDDKDKINSAIKLEKEAGDVKMEEANEEDEENSGVSPPGQSLEPLVGTMITLEEKEFNNCLVLVEIAAPDFVFKFKKQKKVEVGKCEFCNNRNILTITCGCKRVKYCNENCQERDQRFHQPSCPMNADKALQDFTVQRSADAKNGIVGLRNLGNTCYMNSSL